MEFDLVFRLEGVGEDEPRGQGTEAGHENWEIDIEADDKA